MADPVTTPTAPEKRWWQSRSAWGSIVAITAGAANAITNVDINASIQTELVDIAVSGAGIVGSAIALTYRLKAVATIIFGKK